MTMPRGRPILLYLPGAKKLAERTQTILGKAWPLISFEVKYFSDGELKVVLPNGPENSVRGADAFVMQTIQYGYPHSSQDVFMELVSAVATLTECGAKYRTAVIPWYIYACQDRTRRRESITAKLAADFLTAAGATNIITVDVHNDAIEGFFDRRKCIFNGLYASSLLIRHLDQQLQLLSEKDKFAVSAVDEGGGRRIKHICKHTGLMAVLPTKIKEYKTGKTQDVIINENVEGKIVIIFDDMVRSGSSAVETVKALKKKGAKTVIIVATHANFCGNCIEALDKLHQEKILERAIFTDSFDLPENFAEKHSWFHQVGLAELLAETTSNIQQEKSVSHVYLDEDLFRE